MAGRSVGGLANRPVAQQYQAALPADGELRLGGEAEAASRRSAAAELAQDPRLTRDSEGQGESEAHSELAFAGSFELLSVDPIVRVLSASGPGPGDSPIRSGAGPIAFAELWGRLVRRVSWGGDGRRGSARIEIGQGDWAGATIVVHAVERQVAVEIELPAGARLESWRERIAGRLRQRGLEVSELTVR